MSSSSAIPVQPTMSEPSAIPAHIAIIMDGNGRWAKQRGLPRTAGHKKGANTLRATLSACREAGVRYLTVYAFSSENWKRPEGEVGDLMLLLKHYLQQELSTLHENKVCLRFIGDLSLLPDDVRTLIDEAVATTQHNTDFHFTVALSYGARAEIVRAARKLVEQANAGTLSAQDITEESFGRMLDTSDMPEPDLLIRTGGELRLSNFLLWQSAYTEFYFTEVLWPDFDTEHFNAALEEYAKRERRYGNA